MAEIPLIFVDVNRITKVFLKPSSLIGEISARQSCVVF